MSEVPLYVLGLRAGSMSYWTFQLACRIGRIGMSSQHFVLVVLQHVVLVVSHWSYRNFGHVVCRIGLFAACRIGRIEILKHVVMECLTLKAGPGARLARGQHVVVEA